jgi:hypothetical protein
MFRFSRSRMKIERNIKVSCGFEPETFRLAEKRLNQPRQCVPLLKEIYQLKSKACCTSTRSNHYGLKQSFLTFVNSQHTGLSAEVFKTNHHSLRKAVTKKEKTKQTPWPESARELYRPSDRRLSEKLVPTFADRGRHMVSVTYPYGRNLGFLYRGKMLQFFI